MNLEISRVELEKITTGLESLMDNVTEYLKGNSITDLVVYLEDTKKLYNRLSDIYENK